MPGAFMFIDEPGLQFIFSSVSGYTDIMAREDFKNFFGQIERPRGIHLCGNPDSGIFYSSRIWKSSHLMPTATVLYSPNIKKSIQNFLDRGGILSWGLVPTQTELFSQESVPGLIERLEGFWEGLYRMGFTGSSSCLRACSPRPPAVWSTPILKRPWKPLSVGSGKYRRRLREKYRLK